MIINGSRLSVACNSGAKTVKCIYIYGGTGKTTATVGDIIRVSVVELNMRTRGKDKNARMKKGETFLAVIVRIKQQMRRQDGSYLRFQENACVLLSKTSIDYIGTRFLGPMPRELRANFLKIVSAVKEVV